MFESLKKKFSRTSEKLEEELIEEAEKEDNLQEEEGTRFSFFSFGRKKEESVEEEVSQDVPEEPAEDDGDKALEDMTVGDLRRKARGVEGFPLTKQEIKFAKKDELLEAFAKVQ